MIQVSKVLQLTCKILLFKPLFFYLQLRIEKSVIVVLINATRDPALVIHTLILPMTLLSLLPAASLLLPPAESAKLDIQINAMLAYSVYMMILSGTIPPFPGGSMPAVGKWLAEMVTLNGNLPHHGTLGQ